MKELKKRSALKSFIWRIVGVIVLAAVTFAYTGKLDYNWVSNSNTSWSILTWFITYMKELWLKVKLENMMWRSIS